jgi:cell division protein FtsB
VHTPRSIKGIAILASVVVMLAITLIPALRSTLSQQAQIDALRDRIAGQRQSVAALRQEQRQWADPAYVEQQARERLKLMRVGEKSFTVIEEPAAPVLTGGVKIAAPANAAANVPWYGQLWQSMVIADTPAKAATRQPARTSPASPPPSPAP